MQGVYRVRIGSQELLETFVAAPGAMGWRYFGRMHELDTGREVFLVDHVVDVDWNFVRFRWRESDGAEVVAIPSGGGVEVWIGEPGGERKEFVAGVGAVWSASPSCLLVVDRLLGTSKLGEVPAVRLEPPFEPRRVVVRVTPVGSHRVPTTDGTSAAREVEVAVDGRRTRALLRSDLPLQADGWFELVGRAGVTTWAHSRASNPTVLRLHTSLELTQSTIETCPPSTPPYPLDRLLDIPGIRSIDLHRYRARLNLLPGSDPHAITRQVRELLAEEWGRASSKRDDPARTFPMPYWGPRFVAESLRMAGSQPILRALFGVPGVAEAILEPGHVRVRLGRLFSWNEVGGDVQRPWRPRGNLAAMVGIPSL